MARAGKREPSPADMVRTLAVILVPLLVITFFFTRNLRDTPVTTVDYRATLATARSQSPYPVLAPVNLPDTWRATSAVWVKTGQPFLNGDVSPRNRWQLGFLNPANVYIGLNQGDLVPGPFVDDVTRDGVADGTSTVGDVTWQRRISTDERTRSLVLSSTKVTTVVVGDTSYDELAAFASTLSAD